MKQTKPRFVRLLQTPAWERSGMILVEREEMDKRIKSVKRIEKGKGKK